MTRSRLGEEEMRRALRSASVAKTRHKEAKETALKDGVAHGWRHFT